TTLNQQTIGGHVVPGRGKCARRWRIAERNQPGPMMWLVEREGPQVVLRTERVATAEHQHAPTRRVDHGDVAVARTGTRSGGRHPRPVGGRREVEAPQVIV